MLKAGVKIADITPEAGIQLGGYPHCPRPNEGVHDRPMASCFYLDDGKTRTALVVTDLFLLNKQLAARVREKFDFHITFTASHTHSTPNTGYVHSFEAEEGVVVSEEYVDFIEKTFVDLIRSASEDTFDAELGSYIGVCGADRGVGGNRRIKGGLCDPTVNVFAIREKESETVRGIWLCYALHPTYLHAENVLVSADYPAFIRRHLSFAYPEAVFGFSQGTSGNQSSRYHRVAQDFEEACRVGTTLANAVQDCVELMDFYDDVDLEIRRTEITLPRRKFAPSEEQIPAMEAARKRVRDLYESGAEYIVRRNAELDMFGAEDLYYLAKEIEAGPTDFDRLFDCEITVVRLGEMTLLTAQGEIFVEYGLDIKKGSPYDKTVIVEMANGELPGYVYTPDALEDGGYEVSNSMLDKTAGEEIVKAAVALLKGE
jgi:hypothetical protein